MDTNKLEVLKLLCKVKPYGVNLKIKDNKLINVYKGSDGVMCDIDDITDIIIEDNDIIIEFNVSQDEVLKGMDLGRYFINQHGIEM